MVPKRPKDKQELLKYIFIHPWLSQRCETGWRKKYSSK